MTRICWHALLRWKPSSRNGWTGGQYSLLRFALACFVVAVVFMLPVAVWWQSLALILAACLAFGCFDRVAAFALLLMFRIEAPDPTFGLLLMLGLHVLGPGKPFGAWSARGRPHPGGGWRRPDWHFALALLPFAAVVCMFVVPLSIMLVFPAHVPELDVLRLIIWGAIAPILWLYLSPGVRPFFWAGALLLTLLFASGYPVVGSTSSIVLAATFVLMLTLAFDPAWIPARRTEEPEVVYYDGDCGLCHGAVRFLLAEDRGGKGFRYAALQSEHFAEHVSEAERAGLADSVILRTADGRLLQRSDAAVHVLLALGGLWRVIGGALWLVPRPLRDFVYDGVARVRKRLFRAPEGLCPLIPPELGARFLA